MKVTRKCRRCGSWAHPSLVVEATDGEVTRYDEFLVSNKNSLNKKLHVPELDVLPSAHLSDRRVMPSLDTHPCYICRDGAATPGAIGCPYESSCAALALYYILASKGAVEGYNILRGYRKTTNEEDK